MAAGNTYEPIATQTLAAAATTITFSSIAASWTDLKLVLIYKRIAGGTTTPRITFNSSATGYSETVLNGDGATATSTRTTAATYLTGNATPDGIWSFLNFNIFSYAGSTYKTCLSSCSNDANGSGNITQKVGLWQTTSAINAISILSSSASGFDVGTIATLYGIKAA